MTETKTVPDEIPISREEARVIVDCVNFCAALRRQKIFPDVYEIQHIEITNTALNLVKSEEWRQAYLSQDGWLFKLGYIERLDETYHGEALFHLTGKDLAQEEQAARNIYGFAVVASRR